MAFNLGEKADSLLNIVRTTFLTYRNTAGDGTTINDIGKIGLVSPITLVSDSLKTLDDKTRFNIEQGLLNNYAAIYLRAVSLMSTKLNDARILKILDSLNPDRDLNTVSTAVSLEGIGELIKREPTRENVENLRKYLALEGLDFGLAKRGLVTTESNKPVTGTSVSVDTFDKDQRTVGKIIEVEFTVGDKGEHRVVVPVVIKLDSMFLPSDVMANIVTMNEDSIRFGSRFRDMLAGRIRPIRDFLLASDLIKNQKRNLMRDQSRAYEALLKRVNKSKLYSIISRNVSLSTISGIMLISEEENNAIKMKLGGDLTNKTTRKKVFDNSSVMMIAVVDRDWEQVNVFIRDMDGYSTIPFSSFSDPKNSSTDAIMEMYKTMTMGRVPSF